MKKYTYYISAILLVALMLNSSCKKNEESAAVKNNRLLIAGPWQMTSVNVDGVDKTDLYKDLSITFSPGVYTSTNGRQVWPASDTWTLEANGSQIARGDGIFVTIQSISETGLTLQLHWDKTIFGGGRTTAVAGDHTFTFTH